MTETYYQLPAVMLVPNRPGRAPNPPSGEEDLERWAAEANDSFSDLARWAQQIHSAIFDSYIPQTDRIENMIMVGTGTAERPAPIGSRRLYYDLATRILYLDVRDGDTEAWEVVFSSEGAIVVLDTSNFGKVLGPSDGNLQDAMDTIDDHIHAADEITVDVAGFGGILGALDDEVQHALDTLDDLQHSELPDAGTYDHGDIDNHIDDGTIHFLESSIAHGNIQDVGFYTHYEIDEHIDDDTIHFTEGSISHLNIQDIGVHDHADIDSHLYDLDFFHDHGNITGLLDDDHEQYLLRSEWLENGFDDASDTALAWDDGTLTLTLSPAVTSFDYHYAGYKYTESGSLTGTITDTEGLWVFYIGSGGAASLSTIHNPSYAQVEDAILNQVIVAYVYWDATNNDGRLMDERHGSVMGRGTHHYLHEILGSQYLSGMTLGDITTDQNGSLDAHAQFSITAGRFYDEDIEHDTLAHASTDTWECYYVDGSGNVRWVNCAATFPVYAIGGVIAWNNAGTLTAADNNKYILYHVFATNIHTDAGGDYYPVVTPGTAQYGSEAEAQDAAASEIQAIDFGDWPKEEVIPVATVIYHHLAAMANGVEAAIQSTEGGGDFVDWRFTTISGSSTSVNDHGAMSGLADDDHKQYLLASQATDRTTFTTNWDDLTDGGDTTLHGHDVTGLTNWPTIDYSYVSGNDGGTDVSAAELEELTDGSDTSLHTHSGLVPGAHTHVENDITDLGSYLPLTAGSSEPLTGNLYISKTGGANFYLYPEADADDRVLLGAWDGTGLGGSLVGTLQARVSSGDVEIVLEPVPVDGSSDAIINLFSSSVSTTGSRIVRIPVGDGTATIQHAFDAGTGDVDLCKVAGDLTVGGTNVSLAGHTHVESDITDLGDYLPLSAGVANPLTGRVYWQSNKTLYFRNAADTDWYIGLAYGADIVALGSASAQTSLVGSSVVCSYSPFSITNNPLGTQHSFPTSGDVDLFKVAAGSLVIEAASSPASDQHSFASSGDVDLCQQAGDLTVGGGTAQSSIVLPLGHVDLPNGYAVRGANVAGSHVFLIHAESGTYRVVVGNTGARLKLLSNDAVLSKVPASALSDANHDASSYSTWVDEVNHRLYFKVKYSGGTVKSGYISLS